LLGKEGAKRVKTTKPLGDGPQWSLERSRHAGGSKEESNVNLRGGGAQERADPSGKM